MSDNVNGSLAALKMIGVDTDAIIKKAGVEPINEPQQVVEQKKEEENPVAQDVKIDTPLFKMNITPSEVPAEDNLADINVLSNYAKQNGFEIKTPQDLKQVFESYQKVVKEKEELAEKANTADYLTNLLNNLPKEIANPFAVYLNKGDYKAALKEIATNPLDLNKEFTAYGEKEIKKIVDHYYPSKYDEDTWEDLDENVKSTIIESAGVRYGVDRNKFLTLQSEQEKQIVARKDLFKSSINNSISNYKKSNPNIAEAELKEIEKAMYGGLNDKLYNKDGTYKEEAAEHIAFALFGKQTLETVQKTIEQKMQSAINMQVGKANEEIVTRNSDKMPDIKGGDDPNVIGQLVKKQTSFLKKKQLFQD